MIYRKLGKTDLCVSVIGFGCWQLGGALNIAGRPFSYGSTEDNNMRDAVKFALEAGITFFDTADFYGLGKSEYLLGEVLGELKDKVVISTKVGCVPDGKEGCMFDASYYHIIASCDRSLKRLKRDYIDLYLLHFIPSEVEIDESIKALKMLKKSGKIREYGISIAQDFDKLPQLVRYFPVIEGYYNILFRKFENYKLLIKKCDIGFIAASPLSRGILSGKDYDNVDFSDADIRKNWKKGGKQHEWYNQQKINLNKFIKLSRKFNIPLKNLALSYILSNNISTAIPGMKSRQQVAEIAETLKYIPLDKKIINHII